MVLKITPRIILIFVIAITMSFIADEFHSFFGDITCNGTVLNIETNKYEYLFHYGAIHKDTQTHWGWRHWLFFMMGLSIATLQIIDIVNCYNKKERIDRNGKRLKVHSY